MQSWADIAREVFTARGRPAQAVSNVTTAAYGVGKQLAPRPRHSALALDKIIGVGFRPRSGPELLREYLSQL